MRRLTQFLPQVTWTTVLALTAIACGEVEAPTSLQQTPSLGVSEEVALQASPIVPDAATILLDHFDRSTVGTSFGGPRYDKSLTGLRSAIQFDTLQYVRYPIPASLENQGTIELWIRPRQLYTSILNFNWNLASSYPSAGHVLHLQMDPTGRPFAINWGWSCGTQLTAPQPLTLNTWHHLALSWGATTKLYVNGVVVATASNCFRPASPAWAYLNYWGTYPSGKIDELHISSVQRSDAEIAMHARR